MSSCSFGIFFFLSYLLESIFHQLLGFTFIFVKNTDQKNANLKFCLISPMERLLSGSLKGNFDSFRGSEFEFQIYSDN